MRAAFDELPAYGGLSAVMKDNHYWFGSSGFLFTSPWVATPDTVRHAAVILLTAGGAPIELTANSHTVRASAAAVAPLTRRGLRAIDVGLISLHVFPPHPCYRAFHGISAPGVLRLDRARFAAFDAELVRAYEGRLALADARALFNGIVAAAVRELPWAARGECRSDRLHDLLRENPACSLPDLAHELGLSYTGASHYFSRVVGLPLRSYQLWLKHLTAAELRLRGGTLTEIAHASGFTDSSHLCRSWQASYGLSPSYARDARRVRIVA
jgi:AraC family transcriptional regulator, arabinose operon regulatory protein